MTSFYFGPFEYRPETALLLRDGSPVPLGGRARRLLAVLIEHSGEVVPSERLRQRAWPDAVVTDGNLRVQIRTLRRVLDSPGQLPHIVNSAGNGYAWVEPLRPLPVAVRSQRLTG